LEARRQLLKQQWNAVLSEQWCASKHSLHIPIQIVEGCIFSGGEENTKLTEEDIKLYLEEFFKGDKVTTHPP
jgi:hypothetical protein